MKLPVYSSGVGYEPIFPGARMTREQAKLYGDKNIPKDLKKAGFETVIFESDIEIQGSHYFRVNYGKKLNH